MVITVWSDAAWTRHTQWIIPLHNRALRQVHLTPLDKRKHRGKGELRNWLRIFRWQVGKLDFASRWPVLRTPVFLITASHEGGWDCPNQRRSDYCKPISCKGQLIPPPPHWGGKKRREGVKEEFQTLQTYSGLWGEKKKNKKSNQKTKTSFEREKEKGQRSGAEVGEDKEKIM